MGNNSKAGTGTSSMTGKIVKGIIISMVVTMIGTAACAAAVSAETIKENNMGYCAMVIVLLSAVAGAALASGNSKEKRLYLCLLSGAGYILTLLGITALFFEGEYQGIAVTTIVVLSGCVLPMLLGQNRGKGVKTHRSKMRRR